MFSPRIPRFSPSFSPGELLTVAHSLTRRGDEQAAIRRFEHEFAVLIGVRHAVMVPSARLGCLLLLKGLGLEPGDELILPGITYWAIPSIALAAGFKVVPVDIGLHTHVMDPAAFEAAITPRTKAVIPTHLFGTPCDMPRILEIARKHGIKVIEDTAQATGARIGGAMVGSFGDAAYFTFGLTKNMTTLSGAMVTTDDDSLAATLRRDMSVAPQRPLGKAMKEVVTGTAMMIATHRWVYPWTVHPAVVLGNKLGKDPIHERFGEAEVRYDHAPEASAYPAPRAVQAEVGLRQLGKLERLNSARAANGRFLDEHLAHVPGLGVPTYPQGAEPIYMSFVVHHARREALAAALRVRGVDTTVGYMSDITRSPLFPELEGFDCPNAREAYDHLLHIPVHPRLTRRDLSHMVEAVRAACLEVGA
ncbi:MAG: aminotransferase class V-fold PLP-dependent enzyme [Pseudomonadota bacterium]